MRKLFLLILTVFLISTAFADKIDDFVNQKMKEFHVPGLALAIVKNGVIQTERGYGYRDVDAKIKVGSGTIFQLASVTKQFTAMAVMLLVQDGKLSTEDKLNKFIPNIPDAWKEVKIKHLLSHTSGIPNYTAQTGFEAQMGLKHSHNDVIKNVWSLPLEFTPGDSWNYSNTGYYLLGMVIEKVSGISYGDFVQSRIFNPLKMTRSSFNINYTHYPNHARGYTFTPKGVEKAIETDSSESYSAGALLSTVHDMALWDKSLYSDALLKEKYRKLLFTPYKFNNGKPSNYGMGWIISEPVKGHRLYSHNGGITGFSTNISRYIDDKLTIIVLCNLDNTGIDLISKGIAAMQNPALVEKLPAPIKDDKPELTAMLRNVLEQGLKGKADINNFTPEAQKTLVPIILSSAGEFDSWGALKSFELIQTPASMRVYLAKFEHETLRVFYKLSVDNKIEGMRIIP